MSEDLDTMVNLTGSESQVSLADIAGIDMTDVKEVRFENLPIGSYEFKSEPGELSSIGEGEDAKALIRFPLIVTAVYAVSEGVDAAIIVGKKHSQGFQIKTMEDLGRAKAFLVDAGFKGTGQLQELLTAFEGHVFRANIKHTRDKNDKDRIFANIDFPKKDK